MGAKNSIDVKIIVVGGTGVGKTSLACCFQDGRFVDNPPTIGANLFTRTVEVPGTNYRVNMQIWDTAGQERFRAISKIYYRSVSAAIFCYDITSPNFHEEHKYWLQAITTHAPEDALVYVAGTKLDLVGPNNEYRAITYNQCVQSVTSVLTGSTSPPTFTPTPPPLNHRASISVADVLSLRMLNPPISNHLSRKNSAPAPSLPRPRPASMFDPCIIHDDISPYADRCFEVSSRTNTGVRELFDSIARALVEQHIAVLRQKEAPPPMQNPFPPAKADRRSAWLSFRGSDSDRKQHLVGLDGHTTAQNSGGGSCC